MAEPRTKMIILRDERAGAYVDHIIIVESSSAWFDLLPDEQTAVIRDRVAPAASSWPKP